MIKNAMTVDVEDYFQVSAFEKYVSRDDWDKIPCRVEANTNRILDVFSSHNVKATFFTLGWVAQRYPQLIKRIVSEGHELASHGMDHVRATQQTPEEFRADITKTKSILEDVSGQPIKGYRAASYSINKSNMWALDILMETGHAYSSSIYPVKHDLYGIPDAPRFSYRPRGKEGILEIPITTLELYGKKLPGGGGGFFRLYPYALSSRIVKRVNNKDAQPCIFYFHPWEIDSSQPKQEGLDMRTKFRHYLNLDKMESRLEKLLREFSWGRMDDIFLGKSS